MKIHCKFLCNAKYHSWHFNILPYLNFGNNEWNNKSCVINMGWFVWNLYVEVAWDKTK